MTKEDIKKFATKIVSSNPKTKELAKKITKRNAEYSGNDVNNIILAFLERNKYSDDVMATIMEYHPDKVFFDRLYEIKSNQKTVSKEEYKNIAEAKPTEKVDDGKLDCAACATFSAEGETAPFQNQKTLIWSSFAVLVTVILLASTSK